MFIQHLIQQHMRYAVECRIHQRAASLAYSTLLGFIPACTIMVWLLYQTKLSRTIIAETEHWLLMQITGNSNDRLVEVITPIINHASHISWLTIGCLFISMLLLITNAESTFNRIWKNQRKRFASLKDLQHIAVFLLLPIALAITFIGKMNLHAIIPASHLEYLWPGFSIALRWVLLCALYWYLPRSSVPVKSALVGGTLASLMLMLAQLGLTVYYHIFSSLQSFYGNLWMVPTFLLWLYLAWLMILLGAVVTYLHQNRS